MKNERSDRIMAGLADPADVARLLGLKSAKSGRASSAIKVECPAPAHKDSSPSLSLRRGRNDGTLAVKCHATGCGLRGNVFHLLGALNGLTPSRAEDFKRLLDIGDALIGGRPVHFEPLPHRRLKRDTAPCYPKPGALKTVLAKCRPCASDPEVVAWLSSRGLDAAAIDLAGVAFAMPAVSNGLPTWAAMWPRTGHRLALPTYNSRGVMTSARARSVAGKGAKALSPADFSTAGLCLANRGGLAVLRGDGAAPRLVVVTEGEPDFLSLAGVPANDVAVLGVVAGDSWTPELGRRLWGLRVVLALDDDRGGDAHAARVLETIAGRCVVTDVFASGRAARKSGLDWPSRWDLNELLLDGADLLAMVGDAAVVMTPETAPCVAQEPAPEPRHEPRAVPMRQESRRRQSGPVRPLASDASRCSKRGTSPFFGS